MLQAIHTKLLLLILALVVSIASYIGYEKHKQHVAQRQAEKLFRPMRPDEKQAMDGLTTWGKKAREVRLK